MPATFHNKSSFTADGIAYRRIFTGIPFARQIWNAMVEIKGRVPKDQLERMLNRPMLPFFEGRYILTNRELKKSRINQILEIASGMSGRGVEFTESPDAIFVELDLAENTRLKKQVLGRLFAKQNLSRRNNLYLESGNAVSTRTFNRAIRHFDVSKPVAVVCEGFLRYLSFKDKKVIAKNIHKFISRTGGVWITPDIEFLSDIGNLPLQQRLNHERLKTKSGFDVKANLFHDEAHAMSFFKSLGFCVEKHPLNEVSRRLKCVKRLGITHAQVGMALKNRWVYVLKVPKF